MFLSNPQQPHNLIVFHLKTDAQKINGFDVVLSLLYNHCCDCLELKHYMLPAEEHTYMRAIPYLIYLMDSDDKKSGNSIFKSKKIRLERAMAIYKLRPVIPLYGDMQISAVFILQRCAHWNSEEYVFSSLFFSIVTSTAMYIEHYSFCDAVVCVRTHVTGCYQVDNSESRIARTLHSLDNT